MFAALAAMAAAAVLPVLATPVEKAAAETVADVAEGASQIAAGALVDPLQLWGSLTQQFQQIAASALQEVSSKTAANVASAASAANDMAKEAVKGAAAAGVAAKAAPRKTAAKKTTKK